MSESPRSVVIISSHAALFERLVGNAGFSVVGAADLTMNGERLVELFEPAFVILDTDLPGEQDFAAISRIRDVSPKTRVLLVVNDSWGMSNPGSLGVASVLGRDDLLELGGLLLDLEASAQQSADRLERRSGRDRRLVQDWSKVGWEYRKYGRRADDRRELSPT